MEPNRTTTHLQSINVQERGPENRNRKPPIKQSNTEVEEARVVVVIKVHQLWQDIEKLS